MFHVCSALLTAEDVLLSSMVRLRICVVSWTLLTWNYVRSRTGRKGPFAAYYVHIQPGGSFVGRFLKLGPSPLIPNHPHHRIALSPGPPFLQEPSQNVYSKARVCPRSHNQLREERLFKILLSCQAWSMRTPWDLYKHSHSISAVHWLPSRLNISMLRVVFPSRSSQLCVYLDNTFRELECFGAFSFRRAKPRNVPAGVASVVPTC